jgi:hypothetical protein
MTRDEVRAEIEAVLRERSRQSGWVYVIQTVMLVSVAAFFLYHSYPGALRLIGGMFR